MNWFSHHWRVVREALKADKERQLVHRASLENEFLPAALEVVERPVSPTARLMMWILLSMLLGTTAWLVFGRVDVVASASGKILPAGNVKIVQSAGSGVVAAIHVKDGDRVTKGQVLIELDTTLSSAELSESQKAVLAAQLEVARNRALVDALDGHGMHFIAPQGTPNDVAETQRQLVAAKLGEIEATEAGFNAARSSSLADAQAASAQMRKLDTVIPILDRQLAAMQELDRQGYAPGMRMLELQRQRNSEAGDRNVALAQQARGASEAQRFGHQMREVRAQARQQALTEMARAQSEVIVKIEEVTKAQRRKVLQRLLAPEDGTVQQLTLHTLGGVVEPARSLMVIVPDHKDVEVEARVLNKDIGFVREGQDAAVKIETFPFTRYGTVPGKVISITRDAVPDPKLGATYVAKIRLTRPTIMVDGKEVALTSGLGVVADIRTGSRRIITWLLSPLQTSVAQAGRER